MGAGQGEAGARVGRVALTRRAAISAVRIRAKIRERIEGLSRDPDLQGKPLTGDLSGYRSLRAAARRYWIIYRLERGRVVVVVVAVGLRKEGSRADVYVLAQKLLRLRLLPPHRGPTRSSAGVPARSDRRARRDRP